VGDCWRWMWFGGEGEEGDGWWVVLGLFVGVLRLGSGGVGVGLVKGGGGGGGIGRKKGGVVGVGVGVLLASWARKRWEVGR